MCGLSDLSGPDSHCRECEFFVLHLGGWARIGAQMFLEVGSYARSFEIGGL